MVPARSVEVRLLQPAERFGNSQKAEMCSTVANLMAVVSAGNRDIAT